MREESHAAVPFRIVIVSILFFLSGIPNRSTCQTYDGYTLYAPQNQNKAYLLDMSGNTYKTWTFSSTTCYSTYMLAGGTILRTVNHSGNSFSGGPVSGEVQKVDYNGNVTWDYVYSTTAYCSHHDIHPMPNGNVLLIAYEKKTATEATAAGCSQSIIIWSEKIVEVQPSGTSGGTIVWEWKLWDHLCQHYDATKPNYYVISEHPELMNINYNTQQDWFHMNGIDYNAALNQIVVSAHNTNEIYVIDHSTTTAQAATHTGGNSGKGGDFLYRWGNPAAYGMTGTTIFNVVHDAHWVPSTNPVHPNYLCAYNNKGGTGTKTCVDVWNPPYNGYNYTWTAGSAYTPSTYAWRHTYSGSYQNDMGNSQQLPNGNTLVCIPQSGIIYEINTSQTQVWTKTIGTTIPQAFRYPPCYLTGTYAATASASQTSICSGNSVTLNVTPTGGVAYTYSWSSSPAGFTSTLQSPVVSPTVTTTYSVTITNGPCSATGTVTVTVNNPPTVTASATPSSICSGSSAQLGVTVSGGSGYSYAWTSSPTGFTSTLQNPTVTPTVTTTYTCAVTSNGCTNSSSTSVTVKANPAVTATSSPSSICSGASTHLYSVPSGGNGTYTYLWSSVPAGFSSTSQNPYAYPVENTSYTVVVTSNGCSSSSSTAVAVSEIPHASASASSTQICPGESTQLFATPSGAFSYSWTSNPSGFTSSIQNPVVTPGVTTTYTVTVTASGGCSSSSLATIWIKPLPGVTVTASPSSICLGGSSQLAATPSGGSGSYNYLWSSVPAGFSSTLQNPIVTPSETTNYSVTVTSDGCTGGSSANVTVNPEKSMTVRLFIEGLYDGGGLMHPCQNETGNQFGSTVADHITVELRDGSNYNSVLYSYSDLVLPLNGSASVPVACSLSGSFYITVHHRNSVLIVSASPVSFSGNSLSYDFTDQAAKAFGGNLTETGDGLFALYGGDPNQDGYVDTSDLTLIDTSAGSFVTGYVLTDLTGDGFVDTGDVTFIDNNSAAFISAMTP